MKAHSILCCLLELDNSQLAVCRWCIRFHICKYRQRWCIYPLASHQVHLNTTDSCRFAVKHVRALIAEISNACFEASLVPLPLFTNNQYCTLESKHPTVAAAFTRRLQPRYFPAF